MTGWLPPLAHTGAATWDELRTDWSLDPIIVLALGVTAWCYLRGARRLWAAAGRGRGLRTWEVFCFWGGWITLTGSLVSPLHAWGQVLFSAHMTQHELLMLVAAPLLVLGRPMVAMLFALPRPDARQLSRVARVPWVQAAWHRLTQPFIAWAVHAAALWMWHAPALYQATLGNEFVHHLQHLSFFGSALLFWWAVLQARPGALGVGAGVLYLFTTMMHSGLLGALITFAGDLVYPAYGDSARQSGLTPLEDQQLGGLIMWVPAGFVYLLAALILIGRWLRLADRRLPVRTRANAASSPAIPQEPG